MDNVNDLYNSNRLNTNRNQRLNSNSDFQDSSRSNRGNFNRSTDREYSPQNDRRDHPPRSTYRGRGFSRGGGDGHTYRGNRNTNSNSSSSNFNRMDYGNSNRFPAPQDSPSPHYGGRDIGRGGSHSDRRVSNITRGTFPKPFQSSRGDNRNIGEQDVVDTNQAYERLNGNCTLQDLQKVSKNSKRMNLLCSGAIAMAICKLSNEGERADQETLRKFTDQLDLRITRRLENRFITRGYDDFRPKNISNMVNNLGMLPEKQGFKITVLNLLKILNNDSLNSFDIGMIVNGIAKFDYGPEELLIIQTRLLDLTNKALTMIETFELSHLILFAKGMSNFEYEGADAVPIRNLIVTTAKIISDNIGKCNNLDLDKAIRPLFKKDCSENELPVLINAGINISKKIISENLVGEIKIAELATLISFLSKQELSLDECKLVRRLFESIATQSIVNVNEFSAKVLLMFANSMSKFTFSEEELLAIQPFALALAKRATYSLGNMEFSQAVVIASALSRPQFCDDNLGTIQEFLANVAKRGDTDMKTLDERGLAMLVSVFSNYKFNPEQEISVHQCISGILILLNSNSFTFSNRSLAILCSTLVKCGFTVAQRAVAHEIVMKFAGRSKDCITTFKARELTMMTGGFSKIDFEAQDGLQEITSLMVLIAKELKEKLKDVDHLGLAVAANAFAKFQFDEADTATIRSLMVAIAQEAATRADELTPLNIGMILKGLSSLHYVKMARREVKLHVASLLELASRRIDTFDPSSISAMASGLSSLEVFGDNVVIAQNFVSKLAERAFSNPNAFQLPELAVVANACARRGVNTVQCPSMVKFAEKTNLAAQYGSEEMSLLLHSFASLGLLNETFLTECLKEVNPDVLSDEYLAQLKQVYLECCEVLKWSQDLWPKELVEAIEMLDIPSTTCVSLLQQEIFDAIEVLGYEPVSESKIESYSVDIHIPKHNLLIEVDGPSHRDFPGKDKLKMRFLRSRNYGMKIINLLEYSRMNSAQKNNYLVRILPKKRKYYDGRNELAEDACQILTPRH